MRKVGVVCLVSQCGLMWDSGVFTVVLLWMLAFGVVSVVSAMGVLSVLCVFCVCIVSAVCMVCVVLLRCV